MQPARDPQGGNRASLGSKCSRWRGQARPSHQQSFGEGVSFLQMSPEVPDTCPCADSHKKANAMPPAGSPVAGQGLKWAGEPTTDVLTGICWGQAPVGEKGCGLCLCPSFAHLFLAWPPHLCVLCLQIPCSPPADHSSQQAVSSCHSCAQEPRISSKASKAKSKLLIPEFQAFVNLTPGL